MITKTRTDDDFEIELVVSDDDISVTVECKKMHNGTWREARVRVPIMSALPPADALKLCAVIRQGVEEALHLDNLHYCRSLLEGGK